MKAPLGNFFKIVVNMHNITFTVSTIFKAKWPQVSPVLCHMSELHSLKKKNSDVLRYKLHIEAFTFLSYKVQWVLISEHGCGPATINQDIEHFPHLNVQWR